MSNSSVLLFPVLKDSLKIFFMMMICVVLKTKCINLRRDSMWLRACYLKSVFNPSVKATGCMERVIISWSHFTSHILTVC